MVPLMVAAGCMSRTERHARSFGELDEEAS
jgi:hypothetical protein